MTKIVYDDYKAATEQVIDFLLKIADVTEGLNVSMILENIRSDAYIRSV